MPFYSAKYSHVFLVRLLKLEGIEQFIKGILEYSKTPSYPNDFGARIYKIGRDDQGNRLTYMKITGGSLKDTGSFK